MRKILDWFRRITRGAKSTDQVLPAFPAPSVATPDPHAAGQSPDSPPVVGTVGPPESMGVQSCDINDVVDEYGLPR